MWYVVQNEHGKTTCNANRPKNLEEYGFEVPERLRDTLAPSVAPGAALAMAHPSEEGLVDPTDWETELFSELEPEKIFSSPGNTPVPAQRDKNTILYPCERLNFTCPD